MFDTPEDMQEGIDSYFERCDELDKPYTIAGLAYHLGFSDRHSVSEYEKHEKFTATVKRARLRIEAQRSENLVSSDGNKTGMIFDLKNNFDWKDKSEQSITHKMTHEEALDELE
jgi:hypothetical protein